MILIFSFLIDLFLFLNWQDDFGFLNCSYSNYFPFLLVNLILLLKKWAVCQVHCWPLIQSKCQHHSVQEHRGTRVSPSIISPAIQNSVFECCFLLLCLTYYLHYTYGSSKEWYDSYFRAWFFTAYLSDLVFLTWQ